MARRSELEAATGGQNGRLDSLADMGEGWVADPVRGADRARSRGCPAAKEGRAWAAGPGDVPRMREADPSVDGPDLVESAGPRSMRFDKWLGCGGEVRADDDWSVDRRRDIDGRSVTVTCRDGHPDLTPSTDHPSGVTPIPVEMTGDDPIDFRRADEASGHVERWRVAGREPAAADIHPLAA